MVNRPRQLETSGADVNIRHWFLLPSLIAGAPINLIEIVQYDVCIISFLVFKMDFLHSLKRLNLSFWQLANERYMFVFLVISDHWCTKFGVIFCCENYQVTIRWQSDIRLIWEPSNRCSFVTFQNCLSYDASLWIKTYHTSFNTRWTRFRRRLS